MTSGGNNFNYFPENQLTKFSAVLQFKHFQKVVMFCESAVLFNRFGALIFPYNKKVNLSP